MSKIIPEKLREFLRIHYGINNPKDNELKQAERFLKEKEVEKKWVEPKGEKKGSPWRRKESVVKL